MTTTLLAVSAAYVVMALLLLSAGLTARYAWWIKASAIVVTIMWIIFIVRIMLGLP